jgi:diaminopimelate decarboxylase
VTAVGFHRENGDLFCDGVSLDAIAASAGTPVYVYSRAAIEESFRRFDAAFSSVPHVVCYATKANSNLSILRVLSALGAGADVVSGGELRAALECGFPPDRVVFSGVGKTDEEIRFALDSGILAFNAESEREIEKISEQAIRKARTARVALRVNPDIDPKSHPYISTGLKHNKFGVDIDRAREIYAWSRGLPGVRMTGVQAHIGSQIVDSAPLAETARELAALAAALLADRFPLETLDLGGGIGIGTAEGPGLSPEEYAAAVLPHASALPLRVLVEPGRAIVGPAGALVTRVLYRKRNGEKEFVITDAGMNDLIRPPLYGAIHEIEPVSPRAGASIRADVVGPICETTDFFARDVTLAPIEEGDLVAIRDAGAYGFVMASNYNFRPRAAEVLVEGGGFRVVRRRETFEDVIRLERG